MMENKAPPPTYQGSNQPPQSQTYYEPPPQPAGGYAPPPPQVNTTNNGGIGMGQRFTQFYAPPQNRKLGLKRKLCSFICCCILIGLIVGLAAGLTSGARRYNGSSGQCNCRSNYDCTSRYGAGTYCYASCQCARR